MTITTIGENTGNDFTGFVDYDMDAANPTVNYAGQTPIVTGSFSNTHHTVTIAPGISNITGPVTVSAATVNLYRYNGSAVASNTDIFKLLVASNEGQATWNDRLTSTPWASGGASGSGTDRASTASDTVDVNGSLNVYVAFNVATDAENDINGVSTHNGWVLGIQEASRYSYFMSSEGTDGQRPYLEVNHTAAGGTTVTLSDSATTQDRVLAFLNYSRSLESSTSVYDAVTIATVRAEILRILADTASLRDEAKTAIHATRGLQSSSIVSDVIAKEILYSRLMQNALDVSDSLSAIIATIFSALLRDEIAVQDSVSIETLRQIAKVLTDSIGIVDSALRSTDLYRLLSENVESFDDILASIITSFAERVLSDSIAVSDEIMRQLLRSEQVQFIVMELLRRDIDMDIKARNIVMKLLKRSIDDELN